MPPLEHENDCCRDSFEVFFEGKVVTLMGLGLLGRGVGDAAFLAKYCKKVYVTDIQGAAALATSVEALAPFDNIEFFLGGHNDEHFTTVDFVIKGAGVGLGNPYIARARCSNVPIYMSTALFVLLSSIKTIGVTGTRGKTTTTCMIAEILRNAGRRVLLGGNIRGISTLALLPEAKNYDIAVLELDSWQLQGFDDLKISPNIGVFTTFYPDHMNYYQHDMNRYLLDKAAIFKHQKSGDTLVATIEVTETVRSLRDDANRRSNWVIAGPMPATFAMKVRGQHNLVNAGLASAVAIRCGVSTEITETTLQNFESVEGRLQRIATWNGRDFYNDSNATTQEATLAALNAFPSQSIVLIFGGADKELPIDLLLRYISDHAIRCVLISGTGSDRVIRELPHMSPVNSMADAVRAAITLSKTGDNIILSPGFASFGVFKNEYDRSDQFVREVDRLTADVKQVS